MNTARYVQQVSSQVRAAAALGDERTKEIATALTDAGESAVRLALLAASAEVVDEINGALSEVAAPNSAPTVSAALDGDSLRISVLAPERPVTQPAPPDESDTSARISLRLSETLKADIEQAAAQADVSVNTWLVRVASAAARDGGPGSGWFGIAAGIPQWVWGGDWPPAGRRGARSPGGRRGGGRVTGWVTG